MKNLFIAGALLLTGMSFAQDGYRPGEDVQFCTQHIKEKEFIAENPHLASEIAASKRQFEKEMASFENQMKAGEKLIIPIVFHILHENGPENISAEQIYDQMRILNEDFNMLNTDLEDVIPEFQDRIGNVGVEFRLAGLDPDGNCTNGIIRYETAETNDAGEGVKGSRAWPTDRYLNVYTAKYIGGAAGYAYLPGTAQFMGNRDGIMILHNYVGSIGTSQARLSRALTHEIGHWANLDHPWGGSNNPTLESNCNDDDGVTDTPNTIGYDACTLDGVSCGSLDNVQNFMDYSYCSVMFTEGQGERLIAALNSSIADRNNLWTAENLALTGTDIENPTTLCSVEIGAVGDKVLCQGQTVTYTDLSFHNVTSRTWNFPGGEPASSTEKTVTVTYNTPGNFPVELTVSNGTTSISGSLSENITVMDNGNMIGGISENFQSVSDLDEDVRFLVNNPDGNRTWQVSNTAGFDDNKSVYLNNRSTPSGQIDDLIIGNFDMTGLTELTLEFKYAFANRSSSNTDELAVYVSGNCGKNWSLRRRFKGTKLQTASQTNLSFTPSGSDEWKESGVISVNSSYETNSVQIKFEWLSGGGNNIFIDDINFKSNGTSDISNYWASQSLNVYPNPAQNETSIELDLIQAGKVQISLLDLMGRKISYTEFAGTPGLNKKNLPLTDLSSGVYLIQVSVAGEMRTERLIVD